MSSFLAWVLLLLSLLVLDPQASPPSSGPPYRVLACDMFFPVDFGKWRIEEIYSFTNRFHTDIITERGALVGPYRQGHPTFTPELDKRFKLSERYDILIFDPTYNYLNQYNEEGFDGRAFNKASRVRFSYMFRRKEYRNETFTRDDFSRYDAVSFIFLMDLERFKVPVPDSKKWVKLYPGGGVYNPTHLKKLENMKDVGVVVTTPLVRHWWQESGLSNEMVFQPFGTMLQPESYMIPKQYKPPSEKVTVCMTHAAGNGLDKGEDVFVAALNMLEKEFPDVRENIEVYMVGPNAPHPGVHSTGFLNQEELDTLYREKIDIYVNPEPGTLLNGWPLGIEAMIQGSVMITTDVHEMNSYWNFTKDEMRIIPVRDARSIVNTIVELVRDRLLLHRMSIRGQAKMFEYLNYDRGMGKVFDAMEERIERQRLFAGQG